MSRLNNIGVAAELVGVTLLIVLLAVHAKRGPQVVLAHATAPVAGYPAGYLGAFLVAALASAYVLYGFDTAGSLAEETNNPRKYAPAVAAQGARRQLHRGPARHPLRADGRREHLRRRDQRRPGCPTS